MNRLTEQIKILNRIYKDMTISFKILKTMFCKDSNIHQKCTLTEAMLNQIYMAIMEKIEETETNKQFLNIIKKIKEDL